MSNIRFVELANYITPNVKESDRGGWVNYGDNNDFFEYLIELYNNSPTNNACIRGTARLIYGQGIEAVNKERNIEAYVTLKTLFKDTDVMNVCNDYKAFGMAAFEVIMNKVGKPAKCLHLPMNYLRSGVADDEGNVSTWYYATDWSNSNSQGFNPTEMKVFGQHGNAPRAIIIIKQYTLGTYYYSTPDYIGALPWADVESEISNYHLSNLRNGLWPGMLINFNNGVPSEDEQIAIEKNIKSKWGKSSNAGRLIVAFNRDKESAATIEPVQLSDAAEQFTAISAEAMQKILLGHTITSPMLLGIKENTGLGNNAEELKSAHALFVNTVVKPLQEPIINAMNEVLSDLGYSLNLYFKPLTPLEFKSFEVPVDADTMEKETGVEMSSIPEYIGDDVAADWLQHLSGLGEIIDNEDWELEYEEDVTDPDEEANRTKLFKRFANPSEKSEGDTGLYKIRYRYSQNLKPNSRTFCKNMVQASLAGVVYKLEDIQGMTDAKLNIELSPADCKRCGYDIFKFKGGALCHHRWVRQVYFRKRENGKFLPKSSTDEMENDERVSVASAERAGVPAGKLKPANWDEAAQAEITKPNRGFKS